MAETPSVQAVETEDEYIHVRFRDPDEFDEIRTPDWAENVADSVTDGGEVRTGKLKDSEDWLVQSVLVPREEGEERARQQAEEIVRKIEE